MVTVSQRAVYGELMFAGSHVPEEAVACDEVSDRSFASALCNISPVLTIQQVSV